MNISLISSFSKDIYQYEIIVSIKIWKYWCINISCKSLLLYWQQLTLTDTNMTLTHTHITKNKSQSMLHITNTKAWLTAYLNSFCCHLITCCCVCEALASLVDARGTERVARFRSTSPTAGVLSTALGDASTSWEPVSCCSTVLKKSQVKAHVILNLFNLLFKFKMVCTYIYLVPLGMAYIDMLWPQWVLFFC